MSELVLFEQAENLRHATITMRPMKLVGDTIVAAFDGFQHSTVLLVRVRRCRSEWGGQNSRPVRLIPDVKCYSADTAIAAMLAEAAVKAFDRGGPPDRAPLTSSR